MAYNYARGLFSSKGRKSDKVRKEGGVPAKLHLVCPFASAQAVENLKKWMPENTTLWVAAIDPELTSHSYIVPGLGDAGDLCYGPKL